MKLGEDDFAPVRVAVGVAQLVCVEEPVTLGGRTEGDARPLGEPPPGREPEAVGDTERLRDGEDDADGERGALWLTAALREAPPRGDREGDPEALAAAEGEAVGDPVAVGVFEALATTRTAASGGASASDGATARVSVSPDPAGSSSGGGHAPAGTLSSADAVHELGSIRYSAASPIAAPLTAPSAAVPLPKQLGVGVADSADAPPVPQCPEPSRSSNLMVPSPYGKVPEVTLST